MWFFYVLLHSVIFGIGQVVVKKGQSSFTPFGDNVIATLVQVLIIAPLLLIWGVNLNAVPSTLPFSFIVASIYMTYYYVISKGQMSLTATVFSTYPLVTIILSFIFINERLSLFQIFAAIMIIFGTTILALPEKISERALRHPEKWFIWGISGAVMVGFAQFFTKLGTAQSDGNTFTFLMGLSYIPALLLCAIFDKKGRQLKSFKWKKSMISIIGVAMIETELIPLSLAFATGPASLVSLVSSTNVIFMIILAVKFLKERITKVQYIGIFLAVAGILLIGV